MGAASVGPVALGVALMARILGHDVRYIGAPSAAHMGAQLRALLGALGPLSAALGAALCAICGAFVRTSSPTGPYGRFFCGPVAPAAAEIGRPNCAGH